MANLLVAGLTLSTDDRGRLHYWGEVINLEQSIQRWIKVTVRLLDADGSTLAEQSDITILEWTWPSMRNPFYIRFLTPPERFHRFDIAVSGQPHDYGDATVPQPHSGLIAEKVHYREIERADLRCTLIGLLRNNGATPASHVKAAGTLYNPEGKVVGVFSPYLVPQGPFMPGETMPFELKFYALGGIVSNYTLQVQGREFQGQIAVVR